MNRDSIRSKVFGKGGMGFGEGREKLFFRKVFPPFPNPSLPPLSYSITPRMEDSLFLQFSRRRVHARGILFVISLELQERSNRSLWHGLKKNARRSMILRAFFFEQTQKHAVLSCPPYNEIPAARPSSKVEILLS